MINVWLKFFDFFHANFEKASSKTSSFIWRRAITQSAMLDQRMQWWRACLIGSMRDIARLIGRVFSTSLPSTLFRDDTLAIPAEPIKNKRSLPMNPPDSDTSNLGPARSWHT